MNRFVFECGHFQRQQFVHYATASWVPYHTLTTWSDHSPCAESRFFPPHKLSNPTASQGDRQNKKRKERYIPWLSNSRSDWRVYAVIAANRRHSNLCVRRICSGVLQRHCQLPTQPICIHIHTEGSCYNMGGTLWLGEMFVTDWRGSWSEEGITLYNTQYNPQ